MRTAFIDAGGGTRGIYGAGVYDYCMDHGITCDLFIGVSAGSANGITFLAGQKKRCHKFYSEYAFRKEYISFGRFLRTGSMVGLDYAYGTLSNSGGEYPVDYEAFRSNPADFIVVATDAETGDVRYFRKNEIKKDRYDALKASSCVPLVCKPYPVGGKLYYDGGIGDPIPFGKAFAEGCDRVVVVLTRPKTMFRKAGKDRLVAKLLAGRYPKAAWRVKLRSRTYNRQLARALELEKEGKLLIVAPDDIEGLKTLTKDKEKLETLYQKGYRDAQAIRDFLG